MEPPQRRVLHHQTARLVNTTSHDRFNVPHHSHQLKPMRAPLQESKNNSSTRPRASPPTMNKDSSFTYVHMHRAADAELFEDFCKDKLPEDDIYVPPQHQPINPEDEDDVVPDQHAAFGIQRATQKTREPAWKDLGLADLMNKGPGPGSAAGKAAAATTSGSKGKGLPR
ncbi:Apc13 domain-containingprotein [Purpureocillium lilacinum]|uniref:Apc13 domain-containingprotein n=3 Tax=Purpureocillium lilacinum TaxID=33203 RepID=A0A179GRS1_PURLI|nr:Apc13 domain-containingprotein [Purpureocillium lilacinum]